MVNSEAVEQAASQQLTVFDGHPQRRARRIANLCADSNTVGNTGNGDVEWLPVSSAG